MCSVISVPSESGNLPQKLFLAFRPLFTPTFFFLFFQSKCLTKWKYVSRGIIEFDGTKTIRIIIDNIRMIHQLWNLLKVSRI